MGLVKITFFVVLLAATASRGAVIGASAPAQSIAAARIAQLPKAQQAAGRQYLDRSAKRMEADRQRAACLSASRRNGTAARRPRRIADGIVSFQTPAGGWSKNLNVADHVRRKGESFAPNNLSHFLGPDDFDTPADPHWNYVGTLDNDATTTELQFLAKVIGAVQDNAAYRASFLRGVEYLFAAQFSNGGWPQVWPLEGGYHDAITFYDGAVTETLELLQAVAERKFPFVPVETAKRAQTSVARGIDCILNTQITENGKRTVWGQQHDALTLQPVAGRNYGPAAECSSESASMILFLMNLPKPSAKVVAVVHAAVAWLEQTAIHGKTYVRGREGSRLEDSADGKRIWARYYEIGSRRPIFGDRDKSIHDTMAEISRERQMGYSWYNDVTQD